MSLRIPDLETSYSDDGCKFNRSSSSPPPNSEDWELIDIYMKSRNNFLEIGVAEGRSIIQTAKTLFSDNTKMYCVDKWETPEEGEQNFLYNLDILKQKYDNEFYIIKKDSKRALIEFLYSEIKFDFIYIDCDKFARSVIEDFAMAFRLLNVNGILMFDDYYYYREQDPLRDSKLALNMMIFAYQSRLVILRKGKRLILQKTKEL
jgi:predicted O-methyltransferase YrrM